MNSQDNPVFDQSLFQHMSSHPEFHKNQSTSINDQDELIARRKLEHRRLFQQKQGKTTTDVDSLMHNMFIDLSLKPKSNTTSIVSGTRTSIVSQSDSSNTAKATQPIQLNPISASGAADWSKIVLDDELQTIFRHDETQYKQTKTPLEQAFTKNNLVTSQPRLTCPEWCTKQTSFLPLVYQQVFEASYSNNEIQTSILYPILLLSGLRQEQLGQIWSQVNVTQPGILIKEELFMALALIALAQNNNGIIYPVEYLYNLSEIPIPNFQIQQVESQAAAVVPTFQIEPTPVVSEQENFADFTSFPTVHDSKTTDIGSIFDLDDSHLCPPSTIKALSSETQSISSLELPVITSTINNYENLSEKETSDTSSILSQTNNETFPAMNNPNSTEKISVEDKKLELTQFSFFTDELSPIDPNLSVWTRCFEKCHSILSQANEIFSSIQSPALCTEVLQQARGKEYIYNLQEIFHVHKRIYTACVKDVTSVAQLTGLWKQIIVLWTNLQSFFSTAHLHLLNDDDVDYSLLLSNVQHSTSDYCSICLLSTNGLETVLPSSSISLFNRSCLTFAGRHYHSTCANFYLNLVDGILPSLKRNF